jgi:hypothetical protein
MAPITNQPFLIPKHEYSLIPLEASELENQDSEKQATDFAQSERPALAVSTEENQPDESNKKTEPLSSYERMERQFFDAYIKGRAQPRVASYHAVPSLLARSEKGREAFEAAWNKYVSPGFIVATETRPELLDRHFGLGPSLAQRVLWE